MARQRAAAAQRDRQRRGAGRRQEIKVADLGLHEPVNGELESLKLEYWEERLIAEALRPRQRQRARSRQTAGHRPRHAVS